MKKPLLRKSPPHKIKSSHNPMAAKWALQEQEDPKSLCQPFFGFISNDLSAFGDCAATNFSLFSVQVYIIMITVCFQKKFYDNCDHSTVKGLCIVFFFFFQ